MCIRTMTLCILVVSVIAAIGCSRGPERVLPPPIDASAAGTSAIGQYDSNKDGKISNMGC